MPSSSSTPGTGPPEPPQLVRALGLWGATSIVVGIMIGSAIFIVPAEIAREVGSERGALAVWLVTGLLSLFGALSFAELAAMMPQAGGQYIYLREGYGPLVSFLCGWMFFLIQQSGGIATLAVGSAWRRIANAPATCGAAIDVPLSGAKSAPGIDETISTPGAKSDRNGATEVVGSLASEQQAKTHGSALSPRRCSTAL